MEKQTFIAVNDLMITKNDPRLSVTGTFEFPDKQTWTLKIKNVQPKDQGRYRCEMSTSDFPRKSETAYLTVTSSKLSF